MSTKIYKETYKNELASYSLEAVEDLRAYAYFLVKEDFSGSLEYDSLEVAHVLARADFLPLDRLQKIQNKINVWEIVESTGQINRSKLNALIEVTEELTGSYLRPSKHSDERSSERSVNDEKFWLDESSGVAHYCGKECQLPLRKMEYSLLIVLLSKPTGKPVTETDIYDEVGETNSKSSLYDAHIRLNKRIEEDLGIEEIVKYANSNYWLLPEHNKK